MGLQWIVSGCERYFSRHSLVVSAQILRAMVNSSDSSQQCFNLDTGLSEILSFSWNRNID